MCRMGMRGEMRAKCSILEDGGCVVFGGNNEGDKSSVPEIVLELLLTAVTSLPSTGTIGSTSLNRSIDFVSKI